VVFISLDSEETAFQTEGPLPNEIIKTIIVTELRGHYFYEFQGQFSSDIRRISRPLLLL
jgi:hypothetical protein